MTADFFCVNDNYRPLLLPMGLDSLAAVFDFQKGDNLTKSNLGAWRQRIRFSLPNGQYAYLKRYDHAPKSVQLKAWLQHGRRTFLSNFDKGPAEILHAAGIGVPQTLACGGQWNGLFETRSFMIMLELPNARSLEKELPGCFYSATTKAAQERKRFIIQLADFIRRFHETGLRHRDLYLAHIFLSGNGDLSLIDLHRCFEPKWFRRRYTIKDLAQLDYSCPGNTVSRTDRIRFYREYAQTDKLTEADKAAIRKIRGKAMQIARHDRKHGRAVPFEKKSKNSVC